MGFLNGSEALEAIRSEPPDALICDLVMPGMSGIEFLDVLRRTNIDVPVILITADVDDTSDTAIQATNLGQSGRSCGIISGGTRGLGHHGI